MEIGIILTILFVVLRLTGVIDWSWIWVFAPLWIGAIITGIMFGAAGIGSVFISRRERKEENQIREIIREKGNIVESKPPKTIKRSNKRVAFCVIGVILLWVAGISWGIGLEYYIWTEYDTAASILYPLGFYFVLHGSYFWAKEKGRSGWWCFMGLIAPIGYIVLMKLQDEREAVVDTSKSAKGQIETDFIEAPTVEDNKRQETKRRAIHFCPSCGYEVNGRMTFCSSCGRKLIE